MWSRLRADRRSGTAPAPILRIGDGSLAAARLGAAVDIFVLDRELQVLVALPGVRTEDIEIELTSEACA